MVAAKRAIKSLPPIPRDATPEMRQILSALSENMRVLGDQGKGSKLDAAITFRDIGGVDSAAKIHSLLAEYTAQGGLNTGGELETPTQPVGVVISASDTAVIIGWQEPRFNGYWYTLVYRAAWDGVTPVSFDEVFALGQSSGAFMDLTVQQNTNYTYWLRHVSTDGTRSPLSNIAGHSVKTLESLDYKKGWITQEKLESDLRSRIDLIDTTELFGSAGGFIGLIGDAESVFNKAKEAAGVAAAFAEAARVEAAASEISAANDAIVAADKALAAAGSADAAALSKASADGSAQAAALAYTNADGSATAALASKNSAAGSASAASASATSAAGSATAALASKNSSATSETNAATSASTATTKASEASVSASSSATQAAAALVSKNAAATSATAADGSKTAAANSATAAALSETNANGSAAAALVSKNSAETSATAADGSKAAASNSATAAAASAVTAGGHASAALTSKNAAETSATTASTGSTTATTKANEAAASATSASNSAAAALSSKSAASTSETNATTQATTATTKASEASASATSASNSATAALASKTASATSETNATTQATTATTKASEAVTSATSASNSAAAALLSKNSAETSATAADGSKASAKNSATAAAGSATDASGSATSALNAKTNAETSATNAANSAATATTKASEAAISATSSATQATAALGAKTEAATSASNAAGSASTASSKAAEAVISAQTAADKATLAQQVSLRLYNLDNTTNKLKTEDWVIGTVGSQAAKTDAYGWTGQGSVATENLIVNGQGPYGSTVVWEAYNADTSTGAEGGFVKTFAATATQALRFVVWYQRNPVSTLTGNPRFYFGLSQTTTDNLGTTTQNTNPYFCNFTDTQLASFGVAAGDWICAVGYVVPNGTAASVYADSGLYSADGRKLASVTNYNLRAGATTQVMRAFFYDATVIGDYTLIAEPRVEVVDGTQVPFAKLFVSLAAVQSRMTATENEAYYSLKVQADGKVAGFGLTATPSGTAILFNADQFGITNGTDSLMPFSVRNGLVYINDARISQLQANKIYNVGSVDAPGAGLSHLGNTFIEGAFTMGKTGQIKKEYLDPDFRDRLVMTDPNATITGGTRSKTVTAVNASNLYVSKLTGTLSGGDLAIPSGGASTGLHVRIIGGTGNVAMHSSQLATAPNCKLDFYRKREGGAVENLGTRTYTGWTTSRLVAKAGGGFEAADNYSGIDLSDSISVPAPIAGSRYEYYFTVSTVTGTWALDANTYQTTGGSIIVTVSENIGSSGGTLVESLAYAGTQYLTSNDGGAGRGVSVMAGGLYVAGYSKLIADAAGQVFDNGGRVYSAANSNIGSGAGNYVAGNDARLTNTRTPVTTGVHTWSGRQTLAAGLLASSLANTAVADSTVQVDGYGVLGNRSAMYFTNSSSVGSIVFGVGAVHGSANKLTLTASAATFSVAVTATNLSGTNTGDQTTVSGNAGTATVLQTARTIAISGAVTGTATSFNGGANITIAATSLNAANLSGVVPNASISGTYTGLADLTGSGTVDFSKFFGNAADSVAAPSFSWTTDTNTGMYWVAADQVGIATGGVQRALFNSSGVTAATFNGALNGNAATATTLLAARTINGVSFNGSTDITVLDATKFGNAVATVGANDWNTLLTQGAYAVGNMTGANKPAGYTYGMLLNYSSTAATTGVKTQMYFPHNTSDSGTSADTHLPSYRSGYNTDFGSWKRIASAEWARALFAEKGGVGASGTWGISITGTAANANTLGGIGAASFVQTNGNLPVNTWITAPGHDANATKTASLGFTYANNAPHVGPLVTLGSGSYVMQLNSRYGDGNAVSWRGLNGDNQTWGPWNTLYHTNNKPTSADVGALPISGGNLSGNIGRTTHSNGFLVGSYNSVASNDGKTNPIYTIGTSYMPSDTALGNMYGIGYSHSNFWGAGKSTGWGLYVAEAGVVKATVAGSGVWTSGSVIGSEFVGNLNASSLSQGTIPDARISGAYTGLTNLTGSGTVDFSRFYGSATDTAAAPSFSWTTDTNTGIYSPAADQLGIATGGAARLVASSAGVDVTGNLTATGSLTITGDIYANGNFIYGDNKAIVQYNDTWLRFNPSNHFTSGTYFGTLIVRTDGEFQVGGNGDKFKVTSAGEVTAAGTMRAKSTTNVVSRVMTYDDFLPVNAVPAGLAGSITASWIGAGAIQARHLQVSSLVNNGGTYTSFKIAPDAQKPLALSTVDANGVELDAIFFVETSGNAFFKGKLSKNTVDIESIQEDARRQIYPYYLGTQTGSAVSDTTVTTMDSVNSTFSLPAVNSIGGNVNLGWSLNAYAHYPSSGTNLNYSKPVWKVEIFRGPNVSSPVVTTRTYVGTESNNYEAESGFGFWSGHSSLNINDQVSDTSAAASQVYTMRVTRVSGTPTTISRKRFDAASPAFITNTLTKAANGYWKDKETGLIIQWGTLSMAGNSSQVVTFPTAFPTFCVSVQVNMQSDTLGNRDGWGSRLKTTTNFTMVNGIGNTETLDWVAFGY